MGTVDTWSFEGTQGATISGTGITVVGTGQAIFDAAQAVVGGTGGKCTATNALTKSVRCTFTTPSLTFGISPYIRTPETDAGMVVGTTESIGTLRNATGVAMRVMYNPTTLTSGPTPGVGTVGVQGVTGGYHIVASGVAINTMLRWELLAVVATSTTGSITAKAYGGAGFTTLLGSYTSTAIDLGTTALTQIDVGALTALTPGMVVGFDYVRSEDGRTTEFGPPPAVSGPTANAGADQDVVVGTTVTLNGTASTAGSGTLSYSWGAPTEIPAGAVMPAISGQNTSTPAFVAATDGRYTFPLTVTQTGGLTATDSVTIWVYPTSNSAVRAYDVQATTATNEGGAASYEIAVNDTSDSTYLLSALSPAAGIDVIPVVACPFGPGTVAWSIEAYYQTAPCTVRVRVYKMDGTTVIGDTTHTLTTTKATYTTQVDETLIPAQSDRRALVIKVEPAVI